MFRAVVFVALFTAATAAQAPETMPSDSAVLATVSIPTTVLAGGKPLPAGTYQVRFAVGAPPAASGAQRRVELVAGGRVVALEVAEVLREDDLPAIGDSSRPSAAGVRVEMLRGGEFLRISVKRESVRYLIHLAVAGAPRS